MTDAAHTARSMWTLFEPIHAVTYFTPESRSAFEQAGLRGFWRGYFAGRAAPLGPVGAAVVTASFFGFAPALVARAIPGVWDLISPADALRTRLAGPTGRSGPAPRTGGRSGQGRRTALAGDRRTGLRGPGAGRGQRRAVGRFPGGDGSVCRPWPGSGRLPPCSASTAATGISPRWPRRASTAARPWCCGAASTCGGRTCSRYGAGPTSSGTTRSRDWPTAAGSARTDHSPPRGGRRTRRGGRNRPGRGAAMGTARRRGYRGTRGGAHPDRAGVRERCSPIPAPSGYPPRAARADPALPVPQIRASRAASSDGGRAAARVRFPARRAGLRARSQDVGLGRRSGRGRRRHRQIRADAGTVIVPEGVLQIDQVAAGSVRVITRPPPGSYVTSTSPVTS